MWMHRGAAFDSPRAKRQQDFSHGRRRIDLRRPISPYGRERSVRALYRLLRLVARPRAILQQRVGNVVLVDVADVLNGFPSNAFRDHALDVAEPDVRIEATPRGLTPELAYPSRSSVVGRQRHQALVQLRHRLIFVELVHHESEVLDARVYIRIDLRDVAHL